MTRSLKSGKLRHPELPASTTVVTPERNEPVGVHAVVAGIGAAHARAGIDVDMNINQPGRYVEARHIHRLQRLGGIDVARHFGNAAVFDGDVAHVADAVLGVDDVAAMEQQVVWRLRGRRGRQQNEDWKFHAIILQANEAWQSDASGARRSD